MEATPRVTAEELKRRLDEGEDVMVLDVRRGSWRRSDVKLRGAVRMELEEILRPEGRVPRDVRVVTYCT
jgi:rhodanese-related sulfurtransferase